MRGFSHFVAIDWSGAAGERHKGIALAICQQGDESPREVRPGHRWSRIEVLDWLRDDLPENSLVGMDLGQSLPFADCGAFFPGWAQSPADARALWAMVDAICADEPHLGVSRFVDAPPIARHFRRPGQRCGDLFPPGRGRLRVTERAQQAMGCQPTSNFNLVGASQVGKSSLSGMRLLHRLTGHLAVWPIDPLPPQGSVVCEIYTTLAAMAAGRPASRSKIRDGAALDSALAALGSAPCHHSGPIDDHRSDALVTAAWLRHGTRDAHQWHAWWNPPALSPQIARTEGWTFGAW